MHKHWDRNRLLEANQAKFTENGAIGFEAWYDGQDCQPSKSAEDDKEGTDRQVYTWMKWVKKPLQASDHA